MSGQMHASGKSQQDPGHESRGQRVKKALVHEIRRFLMMFLYLYVLFGLFTIHEAIVLAQHHIPYTYYGFALINALILAKVMLVAEDLHLGRQFEKRPLIYPVLIKSALFALVFMIFRAVEELLKGWWEGKALAESLPVFGGGGIVGILSVAVILAFALVPFFAFVQISSLLGPGVLHALLVKFRPQDISIEVKHRTQV
jgi:hypothetical protein